MQQDNVITPTAFGKFKIDEARLEEMKSAGLLIEDAPGIETLEIPEPGAGEQTLGTLTDAEAKLYESYSYAYKQLDELAREVTAEQFHAIGNAIRNNERELKHDTPVDKIAEYYRLQRQVDCLKGTFFWALCEKYNCHEFIVGVRSRRRFVKGKSKVDAMREGMRGY